MKIDNINIKIMRQLQDGKKSFKLIAEDLSIAENTVRSRVMKMIEEKALTITGIFNPEKLPGHTMYYIGIKLTHMNSYITMQEISKLKGVICVNAVTGRYDLIVQVMLNESFNLSQFFSTQLDLIEDITYAETFVVFNNANTMVPYIL